MARAIFRRQNQTLNGTAGKKTDRRGYDKRPVESITMMDGAYFSSWTSIRYHQCVD
jgi:hypothetical protein